MIFARVILDAAKRLDTNYRAPHDGRSVKWQREDSVIREVRTYLTWEFSMELQQLFVTRLRYRDTTRPIEIVRVETVLARGEGHMTLSLNVHSPMEGFSPEALETMRPQLAEMFPLPWYRPKSLDGGDWQLWKPCFWFSRIDDEEITETAVRRFVSIMHKLVREGDALKKLPIPRVLQETFIQVPRSKEPCDGRVK